jgi:hypothetical protein
MKPVEKTGIVTEVPEAGIVKAAEVVVNALAPALPGAPAGVTA